MRGGNEPVGPTKKPDVIYAGRVVENPVAEVARVVHQEGGRANKRSMGFRAGTVRKIGAKGRASKRQRALIEVFTGECGSVISESRHP